MPGVKPSIKVGNRYLMKENGWLHVTAYANSKRVSVMFEDTQYETVVEGVLLRRGTVRDYLKPSVYGVGFLGVGPHVAYTNNKASWAYTKWANMLRRCYSDEYHEDRPTYEACEVDKSWHDFQNFADWAVKQMGYGNRMWALEKDVIVKGNKKYSEDACCFLPSQINNLLLKGEASRGDSAIGVHYHKVTGKYHVQCKAGGTKARHGVFDTEAGAFARYKEVKESFIKEQANKWKDQIDPRAYASLINYEVSIDD